MKRLFILSVILALWVGCASGPIPKEDIIIPITDGTMLHYPAGGFSGGVYFTPEEMNDPEKIKKKMEIIDKFMENRRKQKQKKDG